MKWGDCDDKQARVAKRSGDLLMHGPSVTCVDISAFATPSTCPPPFPLPPGEGILKPSPARGREGWGGCQFDAKALKS
jgi:hypothetical protein